MEGKAIGTCAESPRETGDLKGMCVWMEFWSCFPCILLDLYLAWSLVDLPCSCQSITSLPLLFAPRDEMRDNPGLERTPASPALSSPAVQWASADKCTGAGENCSWLLINQEIPHPPLAFISPSTFWRVEQRNDELLGQVGLLLHEACLPSGLVAAALQEDVNTP